jgi:hypothetical protein
MWIHFFIIFLHISEKAVDALSFRNHVWAFSYFIVTGSSYLLPSTSFPFTLTNLKKRDFALFKFLPEIELLFLCYLASLEVAICYLYLSLNIIPSKFTPIKSAPTKTVHLKSAPVKSTPVKSTCSKFAFVKVSLFKYLTEKIAHLKSLI